MKLETLNLSRMERVNPINKTLSSSVDLNAIIKNSYYADPLRLRIINKRNALERAMLHFANYEKNTTKIPAGQGKSGGVCGFPWENCNQYRHIVSALTPKVKGCGLLINAMLWNGLCFTLPIMKKTLQK
mgnify:CR=1 FL=1